MTTYKHEGETTIKLAHDGDELTVWPSVEVHGGVGISLLDSEEERINIAIASREEWCAFVVAGNKALGTRAGDDAIGLPAPSVLANTIESLANDHIKKAINASTVEGSNYQEGVARGLLDAARMVREAGPTVPRAGVERLHAYVAALPVDHEGVINRIESSLHAMLVASATPPKEPA